MNKLGANEPVRRNMLLAGALVAVSTFFGALGVVDIVTPQVVFAGAAAGISQFTIIAFGAELARSKAWGPATVDEILDADSVIAAAERGEHG